MSEKDILEMNRCTLLISVYHCHNISNPCKYHELELHGQLACKYMLKVNSTLTELNVSDNEIGAELDEDGDVVEETETPEGPAALAEGLAANSSVTQVNVSSNGFNQATKDMLSKAKKNATLEL